MTENKEEKEEEGETRDGPDHMQEPGTSSKSPTCGAGHPVLGPSSCAFSSILVGSQVEISE